MSSRGRTPIRRPSHGPGFARCRGRKQGCAVNRDQGMGSPQRAPISPLLSNLYMRRFVKGWKTGGHEKRLAARIVNYADDFVICCKGTADEAMTVMRGMMSKLKLTVNETKTRMCRLPDESFDFLGYTLGRNYDRRTSRGSALQGVSPIVNFQGASPIVNLVPAAGNPKSMRSALFQGVSPIVNLVQRVSPIVQGVSPIVNLVPAARNSKFRPSRPQRRAWNESRVRLVTNDRRLFLPASVLVADGNDSIRPRLDRKRRLSRPQCRERIETRAGGHSGFYGTAGPRREVWYPQALILRSI